MSAGLEGRVAIVTGGSRGIGAACARGPAEAGVRVVISYSRSHEQATAVVDSIVADGGEARALVADQADPWQAAELVRQVARELGRLDVLINNAAIAVVGTIDKSPPQAELDRQLTVNYFSVVAAIRAAADVMADGGRIVNIGSGVATRRHRGPCRKQGGAGRLHPRRCSRPRRARHHGQPSPNRSGRH
jgi:3-oxoacyl-[acyl-carrier protein] reductase